jgi:hypothetical protein
METAIRTTRFIAIPDQAYRCIGAKDVSPFGFTFMGPAQKR